MSCCLYCRVCRYLETGRGGPRWGAGAPQRSPILEGSPGVLAAAHRDHQQGEEEEEGCCSEAHAVDSAVAEQGATVDVALQDGSGPSPLITPPGQLWGQTLQLEGPIPLGLILLRPARRSPPSRGGAGREALPAGAGPEPELSLLPSSP